MNYRFRVGALAVLSASLIAGCAYLPQGYPSRTSHAPVDGNKSDAAGSLFVDTGKAASGSSKLDGELGSVPMRGLQIRKSNRGNMDSYVVRGQRYFTLDSSDGYSARGLASWYGPNFHGRIASNGEVYDMYRMTAAHKTLPLPTYARVTHLDNGKSIVVKINDRGPFSGDRLIDLSFAAALELGMVNDGTAMVEIKALSPEELLVMSGPDNKMQIDFYYDNSAPAASKQKVAMDSLFVNDRIQSSNEVAAVEPIVPQQLPAADTAAPALPVPAVLPAGGETAAAASSAVIPTSSADEGTVIDLANIEAEYIEVVVPGRLPPQAEDSVADTADTPIDESAVNVEGTEMLSGVDIPLDELADEQVAKDTAIADAQTPLPAVPMPQLAALPVSAEGTLPAIGIVAPASTAAADNNALNLRYYLQAGVFANVNDAERVATNIVLEIPREEVHVKPLKDSAMYRVTIGPIVSKDHATKVSNKLQTAGIENYTVKVEES